MLLSVNYRKFVFSFDSAMSKTIGLYNSDRRSGKTVSAVYLAESFATLGFKTLLLEADPGNMISGYLGIRPVSANWSFEDLFGQSGKAEITVCKPNSATWSVIPYAVSAGIRRYRNENGIDETQWLKIRENYDFILVDLPSRLYPHSNKLFETLDSVIVPVESEFYGLDSLDKTFEVLVRVQKVLVEGILLNRYDGNNTFTPVLHERMREIFSEMLFESHISRNYYLGLPRCTFETVLNRTTHFGLADYLRLANEIIEKQPVATS